MNIESMMINFRFITKDTFCLNYLFAVGHSNAFGRVSLNQEDAALGELFCVAKIFSKV